MYHTTSSRTPYRVALVQLSCSPRLGLLACLPSGVPLPAAVVCLRPVGVICSPWNSILPNEVLVHVRPRTCLASAESVADRP